jgi:two-component system sensor histidine kinase PilS (NtrC family)
MPTLTSNSIRSNDYQRRSSDRSDDYQRRISDRSDDYQRRSSDRSDDYQRRKTNWTPVRLLNIYRLVLAAIFFGQSFISPSPLVNIVDLTLYSWTSLAFLILALIWIVASAIERRGFQNQVSLQIYGDTILIILLMHACGGISSGLGMLLIISVAVTGLLTQQSLAILFASLAALGLLAEHIYSVANISTYSGTSTQVGILGASLIATAIVTHKLMLRLRSSEQLIQKRERDVALLSALNQEIIENMEAGVIVLGHKDTIRHINRAARELLHLPIDRAISLQRDCPQLLEALGAWRQTMQQKSTHPAFTREIGNLQISFRELHRENQPNTMIFLNDVSSIRDSMRQAKLASLGHLTANIAHEIRNPLGAISYAAELLKEGHKLDEADQRMIEIINQHTLRINHIIEDILNISRGSETARTRIDLKRWLPTFVDNYCQSGLVPTDRFRLNFESERATLLFDTGHLSQILTNLCTNACVHGDPDKPIAIRVFVDSSFALGIEIADQGPGINNDILEQIFEPFYTTSHQGSGLGLYIVAQLCELNNASISARINKDNGASFILRMTSTSIDSDNQQAS